MLKQLFTRQLFSSPLLAFEMPDAAVLNHNLMEAISARRAVEPGKTVSNYHGWHSENDLFQRPEPAFQTLAGHITRTLLRMIRGSVPAFNLAQHDVEGEGWVNVNGNGAFNAPHGHGAYLWSGVYYVQVPPETTGKSGMLEFLDPRSITTAANNLRPDVFAPKFQVSPVAGQMMIFPSYLVHWVYPNEEQMERVSIAFNAKIVSRGNKTITGEAGQK